MATPNWDLLTANITTENVASFAPYAQGSVNYLKLFLDSSRSSTSRKNAINHAFEMAKYHRRQSQPALASDWLVAAGENAESSDEFFPRLLEFFCETSGNGAVSWPEIIAQPPADFDAPTFTLTLLRILVAATFVIDRPIQNHILNHLRKTQSELCKSYKLHEDLDPTEQLQKLREIDAKLDELMQDQVEATSSDNLVSVLNRFPRILGNQNHKVTKSLCSSYLPSGYAKSTLPQVLKSIEELTSSSLTQFISAATVAESEITKALNRLEEHATAYVRKYHLPFMRKLDQLRRDQCSQSDATKPAKLQLRKYPRKYPFHKQHTPIRLRFVLENSGPGPAMDIELDFFFFADFKKHEVRVEISSLEVGQQMVEFDVICSNPIEMVEFHLDLKWHNFDHSESSIQIPGDLECQKTDVNWDALTIEKPYSIEAIDLDSSRPFIGREADLRKLVNAILGPSMGCAYIHGQKRVGKTSIGMELASRAQEQMGAMLFPIYLHGGDYVEPDAQSTVAQLGSQLAGKLKNSSKKFAHVPIPEFTTSLTPLVTFIDELLNLEPEARFLILLDEFDELPLELYKLGPIGDSFFLKLRALSTKQAVGIVLIGSEKIPVIVSSQGDKLNKFDSLTVDYFQKEDQWSDFQELVRKPVEGSIEYTDLAVERIYEWTAGNPFFTNMVCQNILEICIDRRDSFVTEYEVDECARRTYTAAEQNRFQHFWQDGVLDTGLRTEEASVLRRKIFLAIASVLRHGNEITLDTVAKQDAVADLQRMTVDQQLKELVRRKILVEENSRHLRCRVKLFERFLAERSSTLLSTDFTDAEEYRRLSKMEEDAYVGSQELCDLLGKWGHYNPAPVNEERLRAWLAQFGSNHDQRLMFKLISGLRFYSDQLVREKLGMAMKEIRKKSTERKSHGEIKRRDVLVTYLGDVGKSGAEYARLFCKVNNIISNNVVSPTDLVEKYGPLLGEYSAIIAIDDLMGTGATVEGDLEKFQDKLGQYLNSKQIRVFIVAVSAFDIAIQRVQQRIEDLGLPIELIVCDELIDSDRAFSDSSQLFDDSSERIRAKEIAFEKGLLLEKQSPLGFGNCEALVCFFSNCPNNSLPIIYKKANNWMPLFPRQ